MSKYIIDANILIQAYRKYYTMDVFISFWEKIKTLAEANVVFSIDKVKSEIIPSGDNLSQWCVNVLPQNFFISSVPFIQEYSTIIRHVTGLNKYTTNALQDFSDASVADAFLIASALSLNAAGDYVLVTEEVSDPTRKKRVKIPDICPHFNVRCISTIEMFQELRITI